MEQNNFNECVAYALSSKNINATSLEEAGMRVYYNKTMNNVSVFAALGKGGIIMPILKGDFIGSIDDEVICLLVSANHIKKAVTLFIPTTKETKSYPIDEFMSAWNENGGKCHKAFPDDKQTYRPNLKANDDVELPAELDELCEKMAEHAHGVWAIERQSEGWTYGEKRDDMKLITPDMVSYSQLPEAEKMYDRNLSMGTLKLLYSLGYKIVKD